MENFPVWLVLRRHSTEIEGITPFLYLQGVRGGAVV